MRILHFLMWVRADIGGPARAVTDLCAALARRGHHVSLATTDASDVPPDWARGDAASPQTTVHTSGLPAVYTVPPPSIPGGFFSPASMARFRALIAQHDVLHLHGAWGSFNVQLGNAARKLGKPYFISIRGMLDDWCMAQKSTKKTLFLKLGGTRWYENAARVHLTAQFEYEQARKYFPRGRGTVIPNLLDMTPFRTLPSEEIARAKFPHLNSGEPVLLFLSRVHVKKGIEVLLRAVKILNTSGTPCRAIIAGSGDEPYVASLKSLCAELNLNDRVAFVGLVKGDEKLSLYRASTLFVLPTSQENFGFVFAESLACATPLVTTKGVDIWPELQSSGAASIAPPTPEATAEAVRQMLAKGPAALKAAGEQGRAWVFDWLNPDRVLDQFEAMYRLQDGK